MSGITDVKVRIWKMSGGSPNTLIPVGVTIEADDAKGTLEVTGPTERVSDALRAIREFDVRPVPVAATLTTETLNYSSTTQSQLTNSRPWGMTDGEAGFALDLTPRVNADGTITVTLQIISNDSKVHAVVRLKDSEPFTFTIRGRSVDFGNGSKGITPVGAGADDEERIAPVKVTLMLSTGSHPPKK